MKEALSLISRIKEAGNRLIIDGLANNGIKGLVPSHGDILMLLYKHEKLTMKEIAQKIHRTKPTVTILIDKLEKLGYLCREKSQEDNRITYIALTKAGKDFERVFTQISDELNKIMYKNFSDEESKILDELLKKMAKNF